MSRWWLYLLLCTTGVTLAACDKVPLTAPTESTITLFSSATFVPVNGTVEITASVIESAGTAVQNGTVVTFTSTVGTIEPREARTNGGKVTVRLLAGSVSGQAQVRAFSGGTQSEPIEIAVGGAAVEALQLVASPTSVPAAGGTVELVATVSDASGNRIGGVPVSFSATAGSLAPSTATSDSNGEARSRLTTNQTSDVTAVAGAQTATAKVTVTNAPVLALTVTPTSTEVGKPVSIAVGVNANVQGATPLRSAEVQFGDGISQVLNVAPGSGSLSQTLSHAYRASGTYTIRATVTDVLGQQVTSAVAVNIAVLPPLIVSVNATGTQTVRVPISFSAIYTPTDGVVLSSILWDFGDGTVRSAGTTTTHVYDRSGQRTVTVTITAVDGRVGRGSTEVIIAP